MQDFDEPGELHTEGEYRTAQVCKNGHLINDRVEGASERSEKHCSRCGEPTLTACGHCESPIRGYYLTHRGTGSYGLTQPPSWCHNCGRPYPWTAKRLDAAKRLASELDVLSDAERIQLASSIDDLIRDTPSTQLAAVRTKKLLAKVGSVAARALWETLRPMLTDQVRALLS